MIVNEDETVSLLSLANSYVVSIENPSFIQASKYRQINDNEKFFMTQNSDGSVYLKSKANGKFVRTRPLPTPQLISDAATTKEADSFTLITFYP